MSADTFNRLRDIVVEQLGVDVRQVTNDTQFTEEPLNCDSLDVVEIVMACELEWGIEIPDGEYEELTTVAKAVAYLDERIATTERSRRGERQ